jgi:hypothetical protein
MLLAIPAVFQTASGATPYGNNDLVADSTTAASVTPMDFLFDGNFKDTRAGWLRRALLTVEATGVSVANAAFTLDLFRYRPAVTAGDNGAYAVVASSGSVEPGWIARLSSQTTFAAANSAYASLHAGGANQFDIPIRLDRAISGSNRPDEGLFGLLWTANGFTAPSSGLRVSCRLELDTPYS